MAARAQQVHEHWSSRFTFIMASIGAAVGLGNIWRFPYMAGENGGGAFVLVYLACVVFIATPLVAAELLVGRRGGLSAMGSMRAVALEAGASRLWSLVGWMGMIAALLILSFYSVIGGWVLAYIPKVAEGVFVAASQQGVTDVRDMFIAHPSGMIFWHAIFMGLTIFIVSHGLHQGIEVAVRYLMPALFFMLLFLIVFSIVQGNFGAAVSFMFAPDFSKLTPAVFLGAVGQAFFSVGVGVAIMLTYGAYTDRSANLMNSSIIIALSDTLVAILAGLAIFPIVFGNGLDPASGPDLIFVTLPVAFGQIGGGVIFGALFFVLVGVAALTSSISILEIAVSWAEEHRGIRRMTAAIVVGLIMWVVGLGTVFSFNIWSGYYPLERISWLDGKNIFTLLDEVTGMVLLPLGGVLMAIFVGWVLPKAMTLEELGSDERGIYALWRFLVRYISPVAIAAILVFGLM